ncbi:ABC transporter permease [Actinopolymorpha sp. NPDC004070]|uniref:ABC transporter permease n=1 Tax=Actinopolymorpha sp. NPDC004070 TaxID=3154548 RepID=UPI0033A6B346
MSALVGTRRMVRLILRRDRFVMPLWIVLLGLLPATLASGTRDLYPTLAQQEQYAQTAGTNPTFLALYGPLHASGIGGLVAQRVGFFPVVLAVISILTVVRHTRTEEDAGRRELLGATVLGRQAGLAAALLVTVCANLVFGLLMAVGLVGVGLPATGSYALGFGCALGGCVFTALAGLSAQLSEGAGAARAIALGTLGAAFVLRVAGDVGGPDSDAAWLSWLSPIGWSHAVRAYGDERWWVFALGAAVTVLLAVAAAALSARRDLGAGILPARLGPAEASPRLSGAFGLAWRLHRGLLLGWTITLALLGVVYGGVADGVRDMMNGSPQLEEMFQRMGGQSAIVDATLAAMLGTIGLIAAAYAVQAALRMRAEETGGRAEPVLATAVGRVTWVVSHLGFAVLGPTVALAAAGITAGLAHGANTDDVAGELPRVFAGAMVQLPAVWVLAGVATALVGLAPRLAGVSWAVFAAFLLVGQVGVLLGLSQKVLDLSPFTHIPRLPGGHASATPLLWLTLVAAVLVVAGLVGVRRRDVPVG